VPPKRTVTIANQTAIGLIIYSRPPILADGLERNKLISWPKLPGRKRNTN
jgi:hypothetical protein